MLKYLGREGVNPNALHEGDTPLHAYVRRGDKQKLSCLMTLLINADCDVNAFNQEGDAPLHLACRVRGEGGEEGGGEGEREGGREGPVNPGLQGKESRLGGTAPGL